MTIEDNLKKLIDERYKSFRSFALSVDISPMTLTNILNNSIRTASAYNVYKICKGLDVDLTSVIEGKIKPVTKITNISKKENDFLNKFSELDDFATKAVMDLMTTEIDRIDYYKGSYRYIEKPFPDMPVSAGRGIELQTDTAETMRICETPEAVDCDFVLRVRGDSMEPDYYDGDIVLVKSQPAVDVGQIGIFILNGEGFMKKLGKGCLISLNEKYLPIHIKPYDEMVTVGLVLGKATL